jgi:SAM-dependent methyltransferase
MRLDATTLCEFYATPLGHASASLIGRRLTAAWNTCAGRDVLCVGFPQALPQPFAESARRVIVAAPGGQGTRRWPATGTSATVLVEDSRLPFTDAVFDRVVLLHALEEADNHARLLREVWRVMAPEGRIIVVVTNRRGAWALVDSTPFGHGRSYTRRQLSKLLSEAMFQPTATARAMFAPPWGWSPLVSATMAFETVGERIAPALGGVILMEAIKRLEARPQTPAGRTVQVTAAAPKPT